METKNKHCKLEALRKQCRFEGCSYVDPVGFSGGYALWWRNWAEVFIWDKSTTDFTALVSSKLDDFEFVGCFIHASTNVDERKPM